ncbi:MAG: RagB/SusD family nutrient uptake outer membrane protein [Alistipes sp.]|jgi:hypothetical protein|nr:RagB/SusD family nutrient uptake outer membrane protein [Alistipes sp.]
MKKIIKSFLLLSSALLAVSCNQDLLEIPQKGVVPLEEYYLPEDAEGAIAAVYSSGVRALISGAIYMPWMLVSNLPSDDLYAAGSNRGDNDFSAQINEYRFATDNDVTTALYRNMYEFIWVANLFLSNYDYGMSTETDRYVNEARVWRAWAHFYLATWWGNPPLTDHVLDASDKPANTPHDELMSWVIEEFKAAAPGIPSRISPQDRNGAVRLTKEAVYSFLGKALVYAGRYDEAAQILKQHVIDSGKYELVSGPDMEFLYHEEGDNSSEKVFEFNVVDNPSLSSAQMRNNITPWMHYNMWHWRDDRFAGGRPTEIRSNGWGGFNPTGEFAEALIANDGIDSHRRKAWIKTYDEFLYELTWPSDATNTTLELKKTDKNRGVSPSGGGLYGHEGYFQWKYVPFDRDKIARLGELMENNVVVMRYAEVLLLYAEACAQSGTDLAGGLAALNMIQRRAGSNHVSTELTLAEVKNEKRFENWMEGTRFPDLRRWGDAATVLAEQGKAIPTFRDLIGDDDYTPVRTEHTGFVDWKDANYNREGEYGFKTGKHEWLPYPLIEVQVNPNIVQNPGW